MKRLAITAIGTVFLLLAGGPAFAQSPTMYTLGDIYYYLVEGRRAAEGGHLLEPPPGATRGDTRFKTLKEIYEDVKTLFDRCDAVPSDVAEGKRFFCVEAGNWGVRTGTVSRPGILATGQIESYSDYDDGWYEKGTGYSYTDNGDGTVTDNFTGLIWPRDGSGEACRSGSSVKWASAIDWVEGLTFAGYSDWRLPNIRELFSLIVEDAAQGAPYVDRTYFRNVRDQYWSSTSPPHFWPDLHVITIRTDAGTMSYRSKADHSSCLWPVRGGN